MKILGIKVRYDCVPEVHQHSVRTQLSVTTLSHLPIKGLSWEIWINTFYFRVKSFRLEYRIHREQVVPGINWSEKLICWWCFWLCTVHKQQDSHCGIPWRKYFQCFCKQTFNIPGSVCVCLCYWRKLTSGALFWKWCIVWFCMLGGEIVSWPEVFFIYYRCSISLFNWIVIKWVEAPILFCGHQLSSLPKASHLWRWPTINRTRRGCPGTRFPGFGLCSHFHSPTPHLTCLMTLPQTPKLTFLKWGIS